VAPHVQASPDLGDEMMGMWALVATTITAFFKRNFRIITVFRSGCMPRVACDMMHVLALRLSAASDIQDAVRRIKL
jgi:hypothetical protein